jgi:hypothetical protein
MRPSNLTAHDDDIFSFERKYSFGKPGTSG